MQRIAKQEQEVQNSPATATGAALDGEWNTKAYAHSKAQRRVKNMHSTKNSRARRDKDDSDDDAWQHRSPSLRQRFPTRRERAQDTQRPAKKYRVTVPAEQSEEHVIGGPTAKGKPMTSRRTFRPLRAEPEGSPRILSRLVSVSTRNWRKDGVLPADTRESAR
eukprot:SAG11_NODE_5237_length_1620_cov_2.604865_1_plen_163_part_00